MQPTRPFARYLRYPVRLLDAHMSFCDVWSRRNGVDYLEVLITRYPPGLRATSAAYIADLPLSDAID